MNSTSLADRLTQARRDRRMSQEELATASGVSLSAIRKLEQGQRRHGRPQTLAQLATALDVPLSELLGVPAGLPDQPADVSSIRSAIYDRNDGGEPLDLPTLRNQTADLRAIYWQAKFGVLAELIPAQLAAARASARAANTSEDQREAQALLAESLQITASLVTHLAYEDLAHVALMQATEAAEAADDMLLRAAQHSTTAWVLSRQGLWRQAQTLATTAAREIEPVLSQASAEQIGVWGDLLHFGMVALAREGQEDEAHELLALVQSAGQALGGRIAGKYKIPFSAAWAGHSAVQLAQATDNPREALRLAERVDHPEHLPPAVRARYLLNKAWALAVTWRSQEALATLHEIQRTAPELIGHHGLARAIVEELMPRRRTQRLPGLIGLAEHVGVVR